MAATGPWCVVASNFAAGTTAADIEAAMAPIGGDIVSCQIVNDHPNNVMAEIVFLDRPGAENVIATFNDQKVRCHHPLLSPSRAARAVRAPGG